MLLQKFNRSADLYEIHCMDVTKNGQLPIKMLPIKTLTTAGPRRIPSVFLILVGAIQDIKEKGRTTNE